MTSAAGLGLARGDEALCILTPSGTLTRGDVRDRSDALLAELALHGVQRALVRSDDPLRLLCALDACSRGAVDLWVAHTTLPEPYVDELVEQFGIQALLSEKSEFRPGNGQPPASRVHMMTSGTTGRPKVAVHTLEALLSKAARASFNRDATWLLTYQPTGFAGIQVLLTAVRSGGVLVVPEQRTPAGFFEAARRWKVAQISGTPTFWRSFLMVARPGELDLRQITLGGEAVDQPTLDRVRAAYPRARVTHIYASTEAGVVFSVHDGREGFPREWLERPNQGVELRIRDGLLQIKTLHAMQRYASESEQPLLDDGWLRTADRCEVTEDRVRVLGRQDSTINVGGSKVYPLAVETVLLSLPGVREAQVFGVRNPISGFLVGAHVVLDPGVDPEQARVDILAACRERLASYQLPRVFKIVDSIQVAPSGKKEQA